ncbi:MAG: PilZ domain-containing protein [Aquificaceae bacterium]|nr:PilZ domain-containing protein [Aquificaceae bacterium]
MDKKEFFTAGKSLGLVEGELEILWECAGTLKSPEDVFWKRETFVKCMRSIAIKDRRVIAQLQSIMKKLRFEELPSFLPLRSTREIELCHPITLVGKNGEYTGILWEKDEKYLRLAMLDEPRETIKKGNVLEFRINREGDGRYIFKVELEDTLRDGEFLILIIPITDKLSRVELREAPRWKADLSAEFSILESSEKILTGTVEDISVRGLRLCTTSPCDFSVGTKLSVFFKLKNQPIKVVGVVRNMSMLGNKVCVGISFEDIGDKEEELIRR